MGSALGCEKPALCSIEMDEKKKKSGHFEQTLVGSVLVPLLGQGEKSKHKVQTAVAALHAALERHLDTDLPDCYVSMIAEINVFCSAVLGLCQEEAFEMLPYVTMVDRVRSFFRMMGDSPMHMLANAVCESPFWNERVRSFQALTLTLGTHTDRIDRVKAFITAFSVEEGTWAAQLKSLLATVKDVQYLQEELKQPTIHELATSFQTALESWWDRIKQCLAKGDNIDVDEEEFQELLMETGITYGPMSSLEDIKSARAKHLVQQQGLAKMEAMLLNLNLCYEGLKKEEAELLNVDDVVASAKAGAGVVLPAAGRQQFDQQLHFMVEKVEEILPSEMTQALELQKALVALKPWMSSSMSTKIFPRVTAAISLQDTVNSAAEMASQFKEQLGGAVIPKPVWLAALMRAVSVAVALPSFQGEEHEWGKALLPKLIAEGQKCVAEMEKLLVTKDRDAAKTAYKVCVDMAGGLDKGRLWTSMMDRPDSADWNAIVKVAKASIFKLPVGALDKSIQSLEEASKPLMGFG